MDDSDFDDSPELEESTGGASEPDNPVRQSERGSIMPSFLHTPSKAENDKNRQIHLGPAAGLKKAEKDAAGNGSKNPEDDLINNIIKNSEKSPKIAKAGFASMVMGKNKGGAKGTLKKKAATIAAILSMFGGLAGFTFFGQATQPFSFVNNIIKKYNTSSISLKARYDTTMYSMMKHGSRTSPEFKAHLKDVGIDVETDEDGRVKGYSYEGEDGNIKKISNLAELEEALGGDAKFASKVAKAADAADTQSLWGKTKSYAAERIGFSRNRFDEYDSEKADTETEAKAKASADFEELVENPNAARSQRVASYTKPDGSPGTEEEYLKADSDTKKQWKVQVDQETVETESDYRRTLSDIVDIDENDNVSARAEYTDEAKVKGVETEVNKKLGAGAKLVSGGVCVFSGIGQSVAAITTAKMVLDWVNFASGLLEATQKVQAGEGTGKSMREYWSRINIGSAFWTAISTRSLFGDAGAKKVASEGNLENIFNDKGVKGVMGKTASSLGSWKSCLYSRRTAAWLDIFGDAKDVILGFATGGISLIVKNVAKSLLLSAAISTTVTTGVKMIINVAVKTFQANVVTAMNTALAADSAIGGGGFFLTTIARAIGHSTTSAANQEEFGRYSREVTDLIAKYDRDNLSPFDTSSPYTFLGSLVNSITTFSVLNAASYTSLTGVLSSVGNVLGQSIASVTPQAFADEGDPVGDCPLVESIGAVADPNNCLPRYAPDMDSLGISYEDATDELSDGMNLTQEGKIAEDSELAEYIVYNTQRDTHPGLADGNIQQELQIADTGNSTINSMIGAVPVIGSAIDIINTDILEENEGKIFGSDYVVDGENWDDHKDEYDSMQAYLELDMLYEELGLIEHSAVAEFLEEYYQKNPLDTSYEGTLARFSGLTKDEVVSTLAFMDYAEFTDNYLPGDRYEFSYNEEKPIIVKGENSPEYILLPEITYSDIRNMYTIG